MKKRHKRKVYSFNSELYKVTGVQKVLMDIHHAISDDYDAKIVGTKPYYSIHKDLKISKDEYVHFMNPFMFYNSIVILHERKFLIFFWILNHILFQRIKLIYIHHNVFRNHRLLSIMPKIVVAISNEGVHNLNSYFKVPLKNIHKIYNCVKEEKTFKPHLPLNDTINILYPARINEVKRQIDIVKHLKNKLVPNIKILFAGEGPLSSMLKSEIETDSHFEYLGYRSDIYKLLAECNYAMLFSKQEGLPITLIEATMIGVPILCNNVGGNPEIVINNKNGFVFNVNDWNTLIKRINTLKNISNENYQRMSNESRAIYKNKFTYEIFKQNYLELLKRIE